MTEKIKNFFKELDLSKRKEMISNYMSELGKKGGAKNKEKGSEYFSKIAKERWKKRK